MKRKSRRIRLGTEPKPLCSREDCQRIVYAKGLCHRHYEQERKARKKLEQEQQANASTE